MRFQFRDRKLASLYYEEKGTENHSEAVVDAFFDVMSLIDAAQGERDLYAQKGLRFEKLKGARAKTEERSVRLNSQWRLILSIDQDLDGKLVLLIGIEDYH